MAWVITVSVDPEKTNVGSATATFTDADSTTFSYNERATLVAGNAAGFVARAVAARDAWKTTKTRETSAMTVLVTSFTTAGEAATAGVAT